MAVKKRKNGGRNVCEVITSTRLKSSYMGNPRLRVVFSVVDGDKLKPVLIGTTATDYMFVYGLPDPPVGRFEVEWHWTRAGNIIITGMKKGKEV